MDFGVIDSACYAQPIEQFIAGEPALDRFRSGLYQSYHLKVAYLLDKKGWTLAQVFAHPPGESERYIWLRTPTLSH